MDVNKVNFPAKKDKDIVKWEDKWYKYNEKENKWEEIDSPLESK
tara:strand:- start:215 stop:346 length:132 start_codon:yes stop_codon:yes gene_type:complete